MSSKSEKSPRVEDLISTEDDTLGSSISLSVGENSIRIKEKPKPESETVQPVDDKNVNDKWWLKRPETRLEISSAKIVEVVVKQTPTPSPDVSSSMKEFLEKEKMCKAMHKSEGEVKDKDDTLCDILASVAFEKYPSDFENATDDDIGSILEEMSKIAGALSPNSGPDRTKSGNSSKNPTEEEKSVEELLEEAEKLVRKNSSSLSKSASKSDTLVPDNNVDDKENLDRVRQLEAEIFQLIEEEVHKESEKIKKSPKIEKKRDTSPSFEIVYENTNVLKPPKTLEFQKRKFEEQKVEISSSSDLDDPIERHSKSEELKSTKKVDTTKDNLQKEITDVDKDFFEDLLRKSKDRAEGGMSGSSSFGQEDFSHFLKLLQGQTDKAQQESSASNTMYNFLLQPSNGDMNSNLKNLSTDKSPEYPEKEISEILEKELLHGKNTDIQHEIVETDSSLSKEYSRHSKNASKTETSTSKTSVKDKQKISKSSTKDETSPKHTDENKKVINSKNELYTVGLTPRLELFADAIPKLIAEKTESLEKGSKDKLENEDQHARKETANVQMQINIPQKCTSDKTELSSNDSQKCATESSKSNRTGSAPHPKQQKKEIRFCKSRSYDQICKQPPLRTSLENIRTASKPLEISKKPITAAVRRSPTLKPRLQTKSVSKFAPKTKVSPKAKKEPTKGGSTTSLPSVSKVSPLKSPDGFLKSSMAGGDAKQNLTKRDWEVLCREERHKNALLKQQLESEAKVYKTQIDNMRLSFEEELFALKKQNIILKAKVDELSLAEKRPEVHIKNDNRATMLEQELEKQERMIRAYETENKKLMQETKRMQEEIKSLRQKQKSTLSEANEMHRLMDRVKDLEEEALKLNLEVTELRQKNADCALTNEDLSQQNGLLNDELEMFKEQLRTKDDFITDRLQAMTNAELQLKKQVEDLNVKLSSKTEQLRSMKSEYEKLQQNVLPLEKELLELRVKEGNLQEKLQVSKSHVEREKQLTQKLKDQVILDNKKIMDLNRQVREMERILKRKNPDSVSALILTANAEHERVGAEKVKLLEERIATLEAEIRANEDVAQQKLLDFHRKFADMKEKYAAQITELESKLLEATVADQRVCNDMFTQTTSKHVENKSVETTKKEERPATMDRDEKRDQKDLKDQKDQKTMKVGPKSQNPKEDAHLLATIRGLKLELVNKDKTVSKITKEYQELQKTNRRLQKEREKLLNDRRTFKCGDLEKNGRSVVCSDSRLLGPRTGEGNDQNSNVYQNGHATNGHSQRLSASAQKLYDPMQYTESSESNLVKRLTDENEILKEELSKINKDFMALKNKRLHDLNLLQEEHEREMASLVKEYSIKFGDSKVVKLQGQINTQVAIITHLKEQIEKLRDYKEQVVVLKAEREHLENKVKLLNEKVKYLSTPGTEQLQLLQDKITVLQQRHESREMTLQTLVRDLLRSRTQCKDCKNEKGKNRQLCYFRQELDHILGMLQEMANVH